MQPVKVLVTGAVVFQQSRVCRSYYLTPECKYDLPSEGIEATENIGQLFTALVWRHLAFSTLHQFWCHLTTGSIL